MRDTGPLWGLAGSLGPIPGQVGTARTPNSQGGGQAAPQRPDALIACDLHKGILRREQSTRDTSHRWEKDKQPPQPTPQHSSGMGRPLPLPGAPTSVPVKCPGALYQALQPLPFWQTYRWSISPLQYRKHFPGAGNNGTAITQESLPLCPMPSTSDPKAVTSSRKEPNPQCFSPAWASLRPRPGEE